MQMRLTFIGADHEVTGSCHFLEVGNTKVLIDCGMEQGPDIYENQEIPVNAGEIDYVFVTHAHIDHSGLLPLLYAKGFRGRYLLQMQRRSCVISCCVTVRIFRCLRRSGRTGKREGPVCRKLCQCTI